MNLFYLLQVVWSIVGSIFLAAVLFTVYVCLEFIHGVIEVDSFGFIFFEKYELTSNSSEITSE